MIEGKGSAEQTSGSPTVSGGRLTPHKVQTLWVIAATLRRICVTISMKNRRNELCFSVASLDNKLSLFRTQWGSRSTSFPDLQLTPLISYTVVMLCKDVVWIVIDLLCCFYVMFLSYLTIYKTREGFQWLIELKIHCNDVVRAMQVHILMRHAPPALE